MCYASVIAFLINNLWERSFSEGVSFSFLKELLSRTPGLMQGVTGVVNFRSSFRPLSPQSPEDVPGKSYIDFLSVPVDASTSSAHHYIEGKRCYDRVIEGL